MHYYAVIDTNVLVSAMLKFQSVPGQVANEALLGNLIPLLPEEIVAEYREVLARPKLELSMRRSTGMIRCSFCAQLRSNGGETMYPVSEAFLQAVQENTRSYYWTGKITTKAGAVYEFCCGKL